MPSAERLIEIFNEANVRLPGAERERFLAESCGNDKELMEQVLSLLQSHKDSGGFLKTSVFSPVALVTERPGDIIGRYKLLEKLGEGGCGVVYVAEQTEPVRRRLALKIIKLGMDTRQVVSRFEAERQALALMDHPNIARALDAGSTEKGRPYFVMELVRGVKITDFCNENQLSTRERLDLFIKVCSAIQHAHQKGVIHRDIKPSNILVTLHDGAPAPKVIDFGIAKATEGRLTDGTVYTQLLHFVGTPAYMSPEQAELSGLDIDTRSDIYSLGVLLYELLTGKTPFDTQKLMASGLDAMRKTLREAEAARPSARLTQEFAALNRITRKPADGLAIPSEAEASAESRAKLRLKEQINRVRGDLDWIVMKCLEKNRDRRYDTANGLAADLNRHLNHEPVLACPPTRLYRFQKTVRRNKLVFLSGGLVALALLLGVVVSAYLAIRATRAERVQSRLTEAADAARQGEQEQRRQAQNSELASRRHLYASDLIVVAQALENGKFGLARTLLAGHRPRPGETDVRGFEWRYLWSQSRGQQEKTISAHSDRVNCLAYSPDGAMLASASFDHTVKIWNPHTGDLITTCKGHTNEVISVAFSPDGEYLASGGEDSLVRLWKVSTWQITSTLTNSHPRLAFSGHVLAVATGGDLYGDGEGTVRFWDYAAGLELKNLSDSGTRVAYAPDGKTFATANSDGLVKLWDRATEKVLRTWPATQVRALTFSPDSRSLAWSAGWNGELRLWNLGEESPARLDNSNKNNVFGLAFSPDAKTLASADQSHALTLWNASDGKKRSRLQGQASHIFAVAYSPDGKSLASGGQDGTILLWSSAAGEAVPAIANLLINEWRWVGHPIISPDSRVFAAASRNGQIQLWDLETGEAGVCLNTTNLPVSFSLDGGALLTRSPQFEFLERWDISTQTPRERIHLGPALGNYYADAISPDGTMIATAHRAEIALRNARTGETIFPLPQSGLSRSLAFSPDSRLLAAGGFDRSARIWNLVSGELILTIPDLKDFVSAVAFSPDQTLFASSSFGGVIKVSVLGPDIVTTTLSEHQSGVKRLAFSPDGKTLASASDDCTVRLWNMATFREVAVFQTGVSCSYLQFSPDGRALAAVDLHGAAKIWRAPSFAQIDSQEEASRKKSGSKEP